MLGLGAMLGAASAAGLMGQQQNAYQNAYGQQLQSVSGLQQQMELAKLQMEKMKAIYHEPPKDSVKVVNPPTFIKEVETVNEKELLPDINLARVFKWGIVLLVAMVLGKKVWNTFGSKITAKLHSELDALT